MLLLVPLALAVYAVAQLRRPRYTARFTNLNVLASVMPRRPAWRRHVPTGMYLLALSGMLFALAKPQATIEVPRQQGTVMLVIDVSGSMDATDVSPTRLRAAVAAAESFVGQLPSAFQVGVVSFSNTAQVLTPPTSDRTAVKQALESMRANGGTAMGDGIERALDVAAPSTSAAPAVTHGRELTGDGPQPASAPANPQSPNSGPQTPNPKPQTPDAGPQPLTPNPRPPTPDSPPAAIVLLSDGASNAGRVQPNQAAQDAAGDHVPVYTIALGTQTGILDLRVPGRGIARVPVPPDPATLQQVAQISGGRFFAAPSQSDLHSIYDSLATRLGFTSQQQDVSGWFIGAAVILLMAGGALATLWFHRFP
ncbi:MAG: VWA domain-containing protein [Chloroflexi bacterium]|nr:VWA domain-containing protein [Chloroflexota bacterium]